MPTRARLAVAVAIALLSALGIAVLAVHWLRGASPAAAPRGLRETAASGRFAGYREVRIASGDRCVRVVVADTAARRERGLRGVADLTPYFGMLFVQAHDSDTPFTMAGVSEPLEITWYRADGHPAGTTAMRPCPELDAARCPVYANNLRYRYALETPGGVRGPSGLGPCG
jgi:uncharacterized membrane protein (UPF0127 family)